MSHKFKVTLAHGLLAASVVLLFAAPSVASSGGGALHGRARSSKYRNPLPGQSQVT